MIQPAGCTILHRSRCPYGEGSTSGTRHRHLQHLLYRFLRGSRAETPQGSLPACASGDVAHPGATRIHPITGWPSLFPTPLPAPPSVGLAASLPVLRRSNTGLPRSARLTRMGEVLSVRRERWVSMTEYYQDSVPAPVPFWLKPVSIFGLVLITTFIESSHVFTIPSIQPRLRLMLADTPFPHGSGASRETVGTVSAGSVRVVTFPHILRRILLMEQQVWSRTTCQTINLATSCRSDKLSGGFRVSSSDTAVATLRERLDSLYCRAFPP